MALKTKNVEKKILASKSPSRGKREKILAGALKAFARKGFYNTKISEIAIEAGVADGTIYLYFKNKDDLLISLFEDRMDWLIQRMQSELEGLDSAEDRIRQLIRMHCLLAIDDNDLAEFITIELRQSAKFVKEYENPKFHDYLHILESILNDGLHTEFSDFNVRFIARAIFGALDEVLLILTLGRMGHDEIENFIDQVTVFILHGISLKE